MLLHVLLATDPPLTRKLRKILTDPDVLVDALQPREDLGGHVERNETDLVIVARGRLPDLPGEQITALRQHPDTPEVVVVANEEAPAEDRARLLSAGCLAVINAALPMKSLRDVLQAIVERRRQLAAEVLVARGLEGGPRLQDFISRSAVMRAFMEIVHRVTAADTTLLILGETGVGKERLARAIHAASQRAGGPFIAVNCGALSESLLESELFGHEEGAFTGATRSRRGCFELAHMGTLFLDEIGELPYHLQVKLLRVLQEHEIQRLGSERAVQVNVRVLAASNRNLEAEMRAGRFRQDLFYRLSFSLTIPPLRERREDINGLVESYIHYLRGQIPCRVQGITPEALNLLQEYTWPGNVRELINVIERAMLLSRGDRITLQELPEAITKIKRAEPGVSVTLAESSPNPAWLGRSLHDVRQEMLAQVERAYLASLLEQTGGKIGETAKQAGITPRALFAKMKRYRLRKEEFRAQRSV